MDWNKLCEELSDDLSMMNFAYEEKQRLDAEYLEILKGVVAGKKAPDFPQKITMEEILAEAGVSAKRYDGGV
jgi:hypothetical protein